MTEPMCDECGRAVATVSLTSVSTHGVTQRALCVDCATALGIAVDAAASPPPTLASSLRRRSIRGYERLLDALETRALDAADDGGPDAPAADDPRPT